MGAASTIHGWWLRNFWRGPRGSRIELFDNQIADFAGEGIDDALAIGIEAAGENADKQVSLGVDPERSAGEPAMTKRAV